MSRETQTESERAVIHVPTRPVVGCPPVLPPNEDAAGQRAVAADAIRRAPAASSPNDEDAGPLPRARRAFERMPASSPPDADTIAEIRAWHKKRVFAMAQRIRISNPTGRFIAQQFGWSLALPEKERKAIDARVAKLVNAKTPEGEWAGFIDAARLGAAPFVAIEKQAAREMERLAKTLPIWASWGEAVNGFGAISLAVIVALAGDLSNYPRKGHLWKRLSIACIGGVRQGSPGKGATDDDWKVHAFSRRKRALVFASLVQPLMTKKGRYREIYLARKAYEQARAYEGMSKMHIHRRAHRDMEQKFIRDLWKAWRQATFGAPEMAKALLPAATQSP